MIHVLWFGPYLEEQAFSIEDENRFWSNSIRLFQLCNFTECSSVFTCNDVWCMKLVCESLEGHELMGGLATHSADFAKHDMDIIVESIVLARVLWDQ